MLTTDDRSLPCEQNPPDLWFSEDSGDITLAKALCSQECPRMLACLNDTLETEALLRCRLKGVHGGLSPDERTKTEMKRIA